MLCIALQGLRYDNGEPRKDISMALAFISRSAVLYALVFSMATPSFGQETLPLQVTTSPADPSAVMLSLADLDALEQITFSTTTIWTDDEVVFSGVSLKALLVHLDASGQSLEMVALNDYAVTMPIAELEEAAPIVATRMNGEIMSVRDKGPYWIVYPYDSNPRYSTETNYARSIWQLNRLKVVD